MSAALDAYAHLATPLCQRYRNAPELFAWEVLHIWLWPGQVRVLRAIAAHDRVAVRSGHKTGKSTVAAVAALWFVCCFPKARVVLTAPTYRQVRGILWKEVRRLFGQANPALGGKMNELPDAGYKHPVDGEIFGFSTTEPERMAGISGRNVLFIPDEASGVAEPIFEAIEGNRAGGAKVLMTGNPTQTSGTFFDAFNTRKEFWETLHLSSIEASKYAERCPGLATKAWIAERAQEWGTDSPLYHVRVLGNFPEQSVNAVVSVGLVEAAVRRWPETRGEGPLVLGVDPARFGDDETVICPRRGNRAGKLLPFTNLDEHAVADKVCETADKMRPSPTDTVTVNVDGHGVGAGVVSVLRQRQRAHKLVVNDVRSGDPAMDSDQYFNLRTQLHFAVADWLAAGGAIPIDDKLHSELTAPLYTFDARGRRKVESKDDVKKRLMPRRSPDRADALALSCYSPGGAPVRAPSANTNGYRFAGAGRGF